MQSIIRDEWKLIVLVFISALKLKEVFHYILVNKFPLGSKQFFQPITGSSASLLLTEVSINNISTSLQGDFYLGSWLPLNNMHLVTPISRDNRKWSAKWQHPLTSTRMSTSTSTVLKDVALFSDISIIEIEIYN